MKPRITIVDDEDNIIGHDFRAEVDRKGLRYRVSALWLMNSAGQILLARRAYTKSHDPGKWGPAVAGTVDEGESYEENIIKETEEELGLQGITCSLGPKEKVEGKHKHFTQWYSCVVDKPIEAFTIQEEEVAEVKWFGKDELEEQLEKNPEEFLTAVKRMMALFEN